jgi:P-type Ca2+ transporter type 2C
VVYAPFLQRAFGTTGLSGRDWVLCVSLASSVLWLREASKAITRATR